MRFRKSVKIAKGVKLNLSKSGASVTLGTGKGLSFNLGGKGAFVNWSIPGTGVYDRVRVDTLLKDKLGGLFGRKKDEDKDEKSEKTAKSARSAKNSGVSEEEIERIEQETALIQIHQFAPDVSRSASAGFDAQEAEAAIEEWLSEAEAPIPFGVETEMLPEKAAVMVDLDLPEIEDMPQDKLTQLADGTIKIKKKTQKESREDYKTCVFGLGEYVAGNVFGLVGGAQKVVVSAYTQRRDAKTGEAEDEFIYSVVFERGAFKKDYQQEDPYDFCRGFDGRFYVLASGLMKKIAPYEPEEI